MESKKFKLRRISYYQGEPMPEDWPTLTKAEQLEWRRSVRKSTGGSARY